MAVAMQSFSIRDYSAKMRAVDFGRCWPFGEKVDDRFLPPMLVPKFRWWADELSAESGAQLAAGKFVEEPMAVEPAVNGEKETVRSSAKAKQRTPKKKKSIVELFAMSAPMKSGEGVDDELKDSIEDNQGEKKKEVDSEGVVNANIAKVRKRKVRVEEGDNRPGKGKRKKKKKNTTLMEMKIKLNKKLQKMKMSSEANVSRVLERKARSKKFDKTPKVHVHKQKKKHAKVRSFLKDYILKLVRRSKLISRIQEARLHSIMRNLRGGSPSNSSKDKKIGDMKGSDLIESLGFIDKDDTQALRKKHLSLDLPRLQKLCKIISEVLTTSETIDNSAKHAPGTGEAHVIDLSEKETVTSTLAVDENSSKKEHVASGDVVSICSPATNRVPFSESVDLNHPVQGIDLNSFSSDCSIITPGHAWSENPKVSVPCNNAAFDGCRGTVQQSFSITSGNRSYLGNSVSNSDAKISCFAGNPVIQQSICFLDHSKNSNKEQPYLLVGVQKDGCNNCSQFHQVNSAFSEHLISSPSYSVAPENFGGQRGPTDFLPVWKAKNIDDGFIGLPLNSQGELINMHPEYVYGYNAFSKRPKTMFSALQILPSSNKVETLHIPVDENGKHGCPVLYQKDQANWFLKHCGPDKRVATSEYHPLELQDFLVREQHDQDKARSPEFGKVPREITHCGCRDSLYTGSCLHAVKFQSSRGLDLGLQPTGQPTVRLMGKNVTLTGSCKESEGATSKKVWIGEERVNQGCPMTVFNKSTMSKHPEEGPVSGNLQTSKVPCHSMMVPVSYHNKPVEPVSNWKHIQFVPQALVRDSNHASSNDVLRLDLCRTPATSQTCPNTVPHPTTYHNKESEPVDRQPQKTFWTTYPQNVCQHIHLGSAHGKDNQGISYMSSSDPPLADKTSRIPTQTSFASSSQNLPHWLLNSRNKNSSFISYHPVTVRPPCAMQTSTVFPFAPTYPRSTVSYPYSNSTVSHTYSSPAGVSVVYPSVAGMAEIRPTTLKTSYRNKITGTDRMEINFGNVKGQNNAKRSRKRPAAKDIKAAETVKKPCLKLQEDNHAPSPTVQPEKLNEDTGRSTEATVTHSLVNHTITPDLPSTGTEKESATTISGSSSPELPSTSTRSRPVKLAAGTKHILKPNESTDQVNSRPIHSTLPFTEGTSTDTDAALVKKAATVFRF